MKKGVKQNRSRAFRPTLVLSDALMKKGVKHPRGGVVVPPCAQRCPDEEGSETDSHRGDRSPFRAQRCLDEEGSETANPAPPPIRDVLSTALMKKGVKPEQLVDLVCGVVLSTALMKQGVKQQIQPHRRSVTCSALP